MLNKLQIWLRAIRFRFLASSSIAVTNGLVLSYFFQPHDFSFVNALLTYIGIFCLHASVDLLNDYYDFKRGIDLITKKTKFSGGTGVLPLGLLRPRDVYTAGIVFLILGLSIGGYFVLSFGYIIAMILAFATFSIALYSVKLVNLGLGELFVGAKGLLIVVGSFYIQTSALSWNVFTDGIIIGMLSSLVLFVNSFPDIRPDKEKGRKTLAIIFEKRSDKSVFIFVLGIFISLYLLTFIFCLMTENFYPAVFAIFMIPLAVNIIQKFVFLTKKAKLDLSQNLSSYETVMAKTVVFSRIYGLIMVFGISLLLLTNLTT
jgi:1,4-dihydroxy-2-naphthoate octaprenyltransferase